MSEKTATHRRWVWSASAAVFPTEASSPSPPPPILPLLRRPKAEHPRRRTPASPSPLLPLPIHLPLKQPSPPISPPRSSYLEGNFGWAGAILLCAPKLF